MQYCLPHRAERFNQTRRHTLYGYRLRPCKSEVRTSFRDICVQKRTRNYCIFAFLHFLWTLRPLPLLIPPNFLTRPACGGCRRPAGYVYICDTRRPERSTCADRLTLFPSARSCGFRPRVKLGASLKFAAVFYGLYRIVECTLAVSYVIEPVTLSTDKRRHGRETVHISPTMAMMVALP